MNSEAANNDHIEAWVWRAAAVVVIGSIMSILDTTIVNVGVQTLHVQLHSPLGQIQWVITGYMLALAAVIPLTGWLSRRFGAKRIYMVSLGLFTAGSALCGLATSATELIVFRVLQGAGGGMIMPVGQLILARAAGPQRMGRVMSVTGVPTMLGPILGPTIGGLILDNVSWRWIFYVNVPIGVLAGVLAWRMLPGISAQDEAAGKLDVRGLILMAVGLPLIVYGIAEVDATGGFTSPRVIVPIVVGAIAVAAFCFHALRIPNPLLDLRLYKRPTFAAASVTTFWLGASLFGAMILFPLYFQTLRGMSIVQTGLLMAPQGIGMACVMPAVGRLTDRVGGGPLALGGVSLLVLASIPYGFIGPHTSILWIELTMFVRGIGIGFAFMPAFVAAFAALERHEVADASPQLNVLMRIGGSLGTAVLAVVLARGLATAASHNPAQMAAAYGDAFWWSLGMSVAALVPAYLLWRAERRAAAERRHGDHTPSGIEPTPEPVGV